VALVLPSPLPKIAGNAARHAMSRENVNISQQCTTFSRFFSRGSDSVGERNRGPQVLSDVSFPAESGGMRGGVIHTPH
jgi:hypothetical protein